MKIKPTVFNVVFAVGAGLLAINLFVKYQMRDLLKGSDNGDEKDPG